MASRITYCRNLLECQEVSFYDYGIPFQEAGNVRYQKRERLFTFPIIGATIVTNDRKLRNSSPKQYTHCYFRNRMEGIKPKSSKLNSLGWHLCPGSYGAYSFDFSTPGYPKKLVCWSSKLDATWLKSRTFHWRVSIKSAVGRRMCFNVKEIAQME